MGATLLPALLIRFIMLFTLAVFNVAFVLIMTTLATIPARDPVAKVVLVFHLLTISRLLSPLQLQQATRSPIAVGRMARYSFDLYRMAIEPLREILTIRGAQCIHLNPPLLLPLLVLIVWDFPLPSHQGGGGFLRRCLPRYSSM